MQKLIFTLARAMALLGGLVLVALILLTCISVLGRGGNTFGHSDYLTNIAPGFADALIATGIGPVTGDYELVEAGIAFAIFAFLPWCQLTNGHATVDIFTSFLSERVNRAIRSFWEVVFALILILLAWRLFEGMQGKIRNGETTFLLQFPIWWAYAASFLASAIAAIVGVYVAFRRVQASLMGRDYLPDIRGASH